MKIAKENEFTPNATVSVFASMYSINIIIIIPIEPKIFLIKNTIDFMNVFNTLHFSKNIDVKYKIPKKFKNKAKLV